MAVIRLYKRFYQINSSFSGNLYNPINPVSITAIVYKKDTTNVIEIISYIKKEADGVYYADLSPILYSYDNTYDLKWNVQYTKDSPNKKLTTSFKLNPENINCNISERINFQEIKIVILQP